MDLDRPRAEPSAGVANEPTSLVNSPVLLVVDRTSTILVADGEGLTELGLTRSDLVGRPSADALCDRPDLEKCLSRALSDEEGRVLAETLRGRMELAYGPTHGDNGGIVAGVLRTPWPRARGVLEQERREERRRLRMIFRQVPGAVWTVDRDLRVTYAAGRLPESSGLANRKIVGATIPELFDARDPADPAVAHHRAAVAGESSCFRYDIRERTYQVQLEPLLDGRGRSLGAIGTAIDVTERRRAEEQLSTSEQRLREAQRVAHLGTWEWDLVAKRVTWSEELHRIFGLAPGQFEGTYDAFLSRVLPEDRAITEDAVFQALRSSLPFTYDHRIVRPDGSVRMLHTSGDLVRDQAGRLLRMVGVCWDVTDRWEVTQQLAQSLSLSRATLDATADGILVVDRSGRVSAFNQRFVSLWRIPPELVKRGDDRALLEYVTQELEEPEAFMLRVRELYDHPEAESVDVLPFRDGRVFERYSIPQQIDDQVVGRVWSFRDVTERDQLLRRALLLSDASRLLASLDVEPALQSVAQLAVPLMGDACAIDLFGDQGGPRRLLSVSREPASPIGGELARAVLSGHSSMYVVGDTPHLSVPLKVHGMLLGAITFAALNSRRYGQADLDLAEELAQRAALAIDNARLYQRAQDALRAREEVLSIAAHEIRGPLTSLHLTVQALRKGLLPAGAASRAYDVIEREDTRLSRLVNELLDVGRIQSGTLHFAFERFDLGDVVRDVAARLGPDLARTGSSLSVTSEGPVPGEWDRSRLEQVAENLISNAIKFGLGRPIHVNLGARAGKATLSVTDEGIGIPTEMQEQVFHPFQRAVSSRHYGGLGLGLYIVRSIVQGLGGTLRLDSAAGYGATFVVELPQARPE
jgi:PAS domain S-box-containing protein